MGMDTYIIRVMHCPVCDHQASHRAVSAFPDALCHRCKGVKLSRFLDYRASQWHGARPAQPQEAMDAIGNDYALTR